jgi:hypothetical protein
VGVNGSDFFNVSSHSPDTRFFFKRKAGSQNEEPCMVRSPDKGRIAAANHVCEQESLKSHALVILKKKAHLALVAN